MKNEKMLIELNGLKSDAESIIKRIETLKRELGLSDENNVYEKNKSISKDSSLKDNFVDYLNNVVKIKESSVDDYLKDLKRMRKIIQEFTDVVLDCEVYEINNLSTLKEIAKKLFSNQAFIEFNRKKHHHFSAPLNNYIDFLGYSNNSFDFDD